MVELLRVLRGNVAVSVTVTVTKLVGVAPVRTTVLVVGLRRGGVLLLLLLCWVRRHYEILLVVVEVVLLLLELVEVAHLVGLLVSRRRRLDPLDHVLVKVAISGAFLLEVTVVVL